MNISDLEKSKKDIKIALWIVGFSFFITTIFALIMASEGNFWFFLDVAVIGVAFYGLSKHIYWIAIALCVYWSFNIVMVAASMGLIGWVVKTLMMYQYIMAAKGVGYLNMYGKGISNG